MSLNISSEGESSLPKALMLLEDVADNLRCNACYKLLDPLNEVHNSKLGIDEDTITSLVVKDSMISSCSHIYCNDCLNMTAVCLKCNKRLISRKMRYDKIRCGVAERLMRNNTHIDRFLKEIAKRNNINISNTLTKESEGVDEDYGEASLSNRSVRSGRSDISHDYTQDVPPLPLNQLINQIDQVEQKNQTVENESMLLATPIKPKKSISDTDSVGVVLDTLAPGTLPIDELTSPQVSQGKNSTSIQEEVPNTIPTTPAKLQTLDKVERVDTIDSTLPPDESSRAISQSNNQNNINNALEEIEQQSLRLTQDQSLLPTEWIVPETVPNLQSLQSLGVVMETEADHCDNFQQAIILPEKPLQSLHSLPTTTLGSSPKEQDSLQIQSPLDSTPPNRSEVLVQPSTKAVTSFTSTEPLDLSQSPLKALKSNKSSQDNVHQPEPSLTSPSPKIPSFSTTPQRTMQVQEEEILPVAPITSTVGIDTNNEITKHFSKSTQPFWWNLSRDGPYITAVPINLLETNPNGNIDDIVGMKRKLQKFVNTGAINTMNENFEPNPTTSSSSNKIQRTTVFGQQNKTQESSFKKSQPARYLHEQLPVFISCHIRSQHGCCWLSRCVTLGLIQVVISSDRTSIDNGNNEINNSLALNDPWDQTGAQEGWFDIPPIFVTDIVSSNASSDIPLCELTGSYAVAVASGSQIISSEYLKALLEWAEGSVNKQKKTESNSINNPLIETNSPPPDASKFEVAGCIEFHGQELAHSELLYPQAKARERLHGKNINNSNDSITNDDNNDNNIVTPLLDDYNLNLVVPLEPDDDTSEFLQQIQIIIRLLAGPLPYHTHPQWKRIKKHRRRLILLPTSISSKASEEVLNLVGINDGIVNLRWLFASLLEQRVQDISDPIFTVSLNEDKTKNNNDVISYEKFSLQTI